MPTVTQDNWRICPKCFGLWYNGFSTNGHCPAGGAHSSTGSGNYFLQTDPNSIAEAEEE